MNQEIIDLINKKLDQEILKCPQAIVAKSVFIEYLISNYNQSGNIPNFVLSWKEDSK